MASDFGPPIPATSLPQDRAGPHRYPGRMSPAPNDRAPGFVGTPSALLIVLLLASCARTSEPVTPARPAVASCGELRGARFQSRALFPAGMGQDGPVLGHQYLSFSADGKRYEWTREDMTGSGDCACDAGRVQGAGSGLTRGKSVVGVLDPVTGFLAWDGIEFERAP